MERSLLYVSRRSHLVFDPERAMANVVSSSRFNNARWGITGSLACTQDHFAQLLEGPNAELDDLMHRIEQDDRHFDLTILKVEPITRRHLPDWSLAYHGQSSYVTRQIVPLIGELNANSVRIERLLSLLVGLATPAPASP